jgi:hypothetical protein
MLEGYLNRYKNLNNKLAMSFSETISSLFSKFLKILGVAVLLFAAYRVYGYSDIIISMVRMRDGSSLSTLIPFGIELVVMFIGARLLFWLSTK